MNSISSTCIKSCTIPDAITEIYKNVSLLEEARKVSNSKDIAIADAVEMIAQHIVMSDEDFYY